MAHRGTAAALAVASAAALAMSAGGFLCFVGPMSEQAPWMYMGLLLASQLCGVFNV